MRFVRIFYFGDVYIVLPRSSKYSSDALQRFRQGVVGDLRVLCLQKGEGNDTNGATTPCINTCPAQLGEERQSNWRWWAMAIQC